VLDLDRERNEAITRLVQRQYEDYPYPDLDPAADPRGWCYPSMVEDISLLAWAGRKDHNQLRILDAGCGTGSPACQCKMAAPGAKVVAIDLSATSLDRARRRAERLGCEIEFHQLPIQEVGSLGYTFDYIVSSGVLHHMPDPGEGLRALAGVLDPQGFMALMVYGTWGRVSIYALQAALRLACDPSLPMSEHIKMARELLRSAPPWYPIFKPSFAFELRPENDGGIVDLLLHVQDTHYDVPRIYSWLQSARLTLHSWQIPMDYMPETYMNDRELRTVLHSMDEEERQAIAELFHGAMNKHSFYAVGPEFVPTRTAIENGGWKRLGCRLLDFMGWRLVKRIPDSPDLIVPMSATEPVGAPLRVAPWQAEFAHRIAASKGSVPLGEIIEMKEVRALLREPSVERRDRLVEAYLADLLSRSGIALIEEECLP
jgi:2-polyprenyl-3-methyl-5-hydroxy-6-metoxy-1,4-benzoquinol methylase